jgi:hypothetical protein
MSEAAHPGLRVLRNVLAIPGEKGRKQPLRRGQFTAKRPLNQIVRQWLLISAKHFAATARILIS